MQKKYIHSHESGLSGMLRSLAAKKELMHTLLWYDSCFHELNICLEI